jgi:hypothetical protein
MTGSPALREPGRCQGGHGARNAYSSAVKNPRLERLSYEFRSLEERHDFSRAAAWEGDLGDFRCRLDQGTMEARPRAHYTSTDAGRQALQRYLRAWELWAELTNSVRVQFRYKSAQVVDRPSTPDAISVAAHAEAAEAVVVGNNATVKLGPQPVPRAAVEGASDVCAGRGAAGMGARSSGRPPADAGPCLSVRYATDVRGQQ